MQAKDVVELSGKWKARFRVGLSFLLLAITPAHSEPVVRDGNWWQTITLDEQIKYLKSFSEGMELGNEFAFWTGIDSDAKTKVSSETRMLVMDSYFAMLVKYLSFRQLRDAVASFYQDGRNKNIEIEKAMWPILEGIAGRPQDPINHETFVLRQKAAQYESEH
jgi:hypothetical protein